MPRTGLTPAGGVRWSKGEAVCWRCGYSLAGLDGQDACPECATPREVNTDIAPLVLHPAVAALVVLCLFGIVAPLGVYAYAVFAYNEEPDDSGLLSYMAAVSSFFTLLFLALVRPPRALRIRTPWRIASSAAVLTVACAAGLLLVMMHLRLSPYVLLGITMSLWLACFTACGGAAWAMTWVLRRMKAPRQAIAWRYGTLLWTIAALTVMAAGTSVITVVIDFWSAPGMWIWSFRVWRATAIAAIVLASINTVMFGIFACRRVGSMRSVHADSGLCTGASPRIPAMRAWRRAGVVICLLAAPLMLLASPITTFVVADAIDWPPFVWVHPAAVLAFCVFAFVLLVLLHRVCAPDAAALWRLACGGAATTMLLAGMVLAPIIGIGQFELWQVEHLVDAPWIAGLASFAVICLTMAFNMRTWCAGRQAAAWAAAAVLFGLAACVGIVATLSQRYGMRAPLLGGAYGVLAFGAAALGALVTFAAAVAFWRTAMNPRDRQTVSEPGGGA